MKTQCEMRFGCFEEHEPIKSLRHSICPLKPATAVCAGTWLLAPTFRGTPMSGTEEAYQLRMTYDPGVAIGLVKAE